MRVGKPETGIRKRLPGALRSRRVGKLESGSDRLARSVPTVYDLHAPINCGYSDWVGLGMAPKGLGFKPESGSDRLARSVPTVCRLYALCLWRG